MFGFVFNLCVVWILVVVCVFGLVLMGCFGLLGLVLWWFVLGVGGLCFEFDWSGFVGWFVWMIFLGFVDCCGDFVCVCLVLSWLRFWLRLFLVWGLFGL